jgi:hypothetical protein
MLSKISSAQPQASQKLPSAINKFSKVLWSLFEQAAVTKNTITYYDCCFTFTSRKKTKTAGHPAAGGITANSFMKKHGIKNQADLAATLLHLSQTRTDSLQFTVPTHNQDHKSEEFLGKRQPQPLPPTISALEDRVAALEKMLEAEIENNKRFHSLFKMERLERERYQADSTGWRYVVRQQDRYLEKHGWKFDCREVYAIASSISNRELIMRRNSTYYEIYPAPAPLPCTVIQPNDDTLPELPEIEVEPAERVIPDYTPARPQ